MKFGIEFAGDVLAREYVLKEILRENHVGPAYSDLGYILLGMVLQRLHSKKLLDVATWLYSSLGLKERPFFIPVEGGRAIREIDGVVATRKTELRGLIRGVVDDDNAFVLGGVAGHAGLFGSARAVHRVLELLLASFNGDGPFPEVVVKGFWDYSNRQGTSFVLGFDTPSGNNTQAGRNAPSGTVGHLGFTGTSFWLDPKSGLGSVLLTNRVRLLPDSKFEIAALRRRVHGLVWDRWS